MADYSQTDRPIRIITSLGDDMFLVRSFRGEEHLSGLFHFQLELLSISEGLAFPDVLGQPVTLQLQLADQTFRSFHGHINRFVQGQRDSLGLTTFHAEVVPWLWFLTRTADCRIFQGKSTQEIVSQVFDDLGYSDYEFRALAGGQEPRVYCVQYRETAFNFVSRLLEEDGIFYYFKHTEGKHILVLADSSAEHEDCPGQAEVRWAPQTERAVREDDVVLEATWSQDIQTGKIALTDYNFEMPSTDLGVQLAGDGDLEIYDFPGRYDNLGAGDVYARVRLEEKAAAVPRMIGASTCRAFVVGHKFTLTEHFRDDLETRLVLASIQHRGHQSIQADGTQDDGGFYYRNRFAALPYSVPFRPPRVARKPVIHGAHSARVVGPSGEEIWTDQYGRIKVQFPWDREGQSDENSSCWIRVSQAWAGSSWGAMQIPRIGHEVIVDFLEGDPDRPIVTGRVYNAENMPPYALPGDQTKSTIKSESSKGGGGFNELRFEDLSGSEEIFLHGQKDWTIEILNDKNQSVGHDETLSVGNDRTKTVGNDQSEDIGNDKTIHVAANHTEAIDADKSMTIGGSHTESITGDKSMDVGGSHTESIGGDKSLTVGAGHSETIATDMTVNVGANLTENVGANHTETVAAAMTLTVGATLTQTVGGALAQTVGGAMSLGVGGVMSLTAGASMSQQVGSGLSTSAGGTISTSAGKKFSVSSGKELSLNGGTKVAIEAADELSLTCGSASIVLKKSGDISIKGNKITLKGSGDVVIKGSKIAQN